VRKAIIGLAVAGILLVVPGCGDGDSSVSKADYDRQLELACNKGLREREETVEQINKDYEENQAQKATTEFQIENLMTLIGLYEETTEEIADIGLPEQKEKEAEELLTAREEATAKINADPLGTRDSLTTIFADANKLAEDLGAKACSF